MIAPEREADPASNLDDIFVPGLGVRGALDDETPSRLSFSPNFAGSFRRALALLRRSKEASCNHLRNLARRSAFTYSSTAARMKMNLQATFPARLNSTTNTLRKIQRRFASDARSAATSMANLTGRIVPTLRTTTDLGVRALPHLRVQLLRVRQITRIQTHRLRNLPLGLPRTPLGVRHAYRRARFFLRSSATSMANRLREYKSTIHIPRFEKPTLARLRHAAPALGILFVLLVFVIQEFVLAAKR